MPNQRGFTPILLLLLAAGAVIIYILVSSTFPFKDKLFSLLYPKPPSHAQQVAESVPDEILLKFKPGVDEKSKNNIRKHFGIKKEDEITQIGVERGKVLEKAKDKIIEALKHNPQVEYAEPNYINKAMLTANDTYFPRQWALAKISAPTAWDISTGTTSAVIAILDSGVNLTHEDLAGKVSGTADDYGHGTLVAGVAAASSNNGKGVASVCWGCPILSYKVLNSMGFGSNWDLDQAIPAATDQGAKVINMSLGTQSYMPDVQDATNYAWNKGVVVVAAAGNDSTSTPFYPAALNNVVAVSNSNGSDSLDTTSNYGSWVDVAAPGISIITTTMAGGYEAAGGTSISSPHVAGLAGLIFSANSSLTNSQVVDIIISTADDTAAGKRINAYKALQKATNTPPPPPDTTSPTISITSPTGGSTVSGIIDITADASDNVGVTKVEFYIDGTLFATDTTSTSFLASWDTTQATNTPHTLQTKAYDNAGNVGSSSSITVTVSNIALSPSPTPTPTPSDTTPPSVSITSPLNGAIVKTNSKVTITANASDNISVSKVEFYVGTSLKCTDTTTPSYSCTWSVPGKKNIQYTITVKAYDSSNNTQSANIKVTAQ